MFKFFEDSFAYFYKQLALRFSPDSIFKLFICILFIFLKFIVNKKRKEEKLYDEIVNCWCDWKIKKRK